MAYSFASGVLVAEDLYADQANDRGYPVAVAAQLIERLVACLDEVHLHALDKLLEVCCGYVEGERRVSQRCEDSLLIVTVSGAHEPLTGLGKQPPLLVERKVLVGYVVTEAAEGVRGVDRAALPRGQGAEGVVEVPSVLFGDALAVVVGEVKFSSHGKPRGQRLFGRQALPRSLSLSMVLSISRIFSDLDTAGRRLRTS